MARPISPHFIAPDGEPSAHEPLPVGMRRTRSGKVKRRNIVWRARKVLLVAVIMVVLGASGGVYGLWTNTSLPPTDDQAEISFLCTADVQKDCNRETAFAEYGQDQATVHVSYDQIPQVFINALVAAEDKDFFTHQGVDPTGVGRALVHELRSDGKGQQGGSTITQQYIKNVTKDDALTMKRKVEEAIRAMKLEQDLTKEQILERYLNTIYFGRNANSLEAAVRAYFGPDKKVEDLDLPMSAYLAAIIREPELADAQRQLTDPKREEQQRYATTRRRQVLNAMAEQQYISPDERDRVAAMGWDYVIPRGSTVKGVVTKYGEIGSSYWPQYVKAWLEESGVLTKGELLNKGLRVYTTFDPALQAVAWRAVHDVVPDTTDPEAALASIDDQGRVRAMVGGREFGRGPGQSEVNLAAGSLGGGGAGRQPGSAFKPITLAQYLTQGGSLDKLYPNPDKIDLPGEFPTIESVEGDATREDIDLRFATAISSNTVYAQLQRDIGEKATVDLAVKLGIPQTQFEERSYNSVRLALGDTVDVSPVDLAGVYSTFANGGEKIGPFPVSKVTNSVGQVLWEAPTERARLLTEDVAGQVNWTLKNVMEDPKGTGFQNARVPGQIVAGKTGTTDGFTNAWFAGYTCKQTAVVWMGYPQGNKEMENVRGVAEVYGSTLPAKIFASYMGAALAGKESCPFERPLSSMPTTTVPPPTSAPRTSAPTTATPTTTAASSSTTDPGDATSTTRRFPFPTLPVPSTTDPEATPTPRRSPFPTRPTTSTTVDPQQPPAGANPQPGNPARPAGG